MTSRNRILACALCAAGHMWAPAGDAEHAAAGTMQWNLEISEQGLWAPMNHAAGTLYFGSDDGGFYALDVATRQIEWRFATGDIVRSGSASPKWVFVISLPSRAEAPRSPVVGPFADERSTGTSGATPAADPRPPAEKRYTLLPWRKSQNRQ